MRCKSIGDYDAKQLGDLQDNLKDAMDRMEKVVLRQKDEDKV
jgi:hypothetical protein